MRPVPAPGQTLAPATAPEPARLRHRADLRSRIPGHRELLPARPGRLAARRAALERRDVPAENPGRQARLLRLQDRGTLQSQGRDQGRTADLLRGSETARGQAGPGSAIRRDTPHTRPARGHPRPGPGPGHRPSQGADLPAPHSDDASYASTAPRWLSTRSPGSPASAGQDRASPRGHPSWQKCGARHSSSAPPATTTSTQTPSRTRHKSLESPVHRKVPAGFGGRLRGKGPQQRDLAAQPILLRGVLGAAPLRRCRSSEDQHPVECIRGARSRRSVRRSVRPRTPRRDLDHLDARIGRTPRRTTAVNCPARSRIRNRNRATCSPRSMTQVAGLLGGPGAGRDGGDAQEVHAAVAVLEHEQDVEPAQRETRVDVGEVDGEHAGPACAGTAARLVSVRRSGAVGSGGAAGSGGSSRRRRGGRA